MAVLFAQSGRIGPFVCARPDIFFANGRSKSDHPSLDGSTRPRPCIHDIGFPCCIPRGGDCDDKTHGLAFRIDARRSRWNLRLQQAGRAFERSQPRPRCSLGGAGTYPGANERAARRHLRRRAVTRSPPGAGAVDDSTGGTPVSACRDSSGSGSGSDAATDSGNHRGRDALAGRACNDSRNHVPPAGAGEPGTRALQDRGRGLPRRTVPDHAVIV